MTGFERIYMIAEKEYTLAMNEIAHAQAIIESSLELNMQRAELKVLQESGTELDLLYLYEAAGAEANAAANQQGFFSKIGNAIKNAITRVWNAIQKVFTGQDTEAYKNWQKAQGKFKINIPDPSELLNTVEGELNKVNGKGILLGAAGLAASFGAIAGAVKAFKSKENTVETVADEGKAKGWIAAKDRIVGLIDSIFKKPENDTAQTNGEEATATNEKGEQVKGDAKSFFQKIGDVAKNAVLYITTPIVNGLSKIGVKVGGKNKQQDASTGNANNANTNNPSTGNANNANTNNPSTGNANNANDWGDGADGMNESVEYKLARLDAMLEGL